MYPGTEVHSASRDGTAAPPLCERTEQYHLLTHHSTWVGQYSQEYYWAGVLLLGLTVDRYGGYDQHHLSGTHRVARSVVLVVPPSSCQYEVRLRSHLRTVQLAW